MASNATDAGLLNPGRTAGIFISSRRISSARPCPLDVAITMSASRKAVPESLKRVAKLIDPTSQGAQHIRIG
jgi:hypothetical protein